MTTSGEHLASAPAGFQCFDCGIWHSEQPLSFHSAAPAVWTADMDGEEGCQLTSDACIVHDEHFFIRGLIRVPIVGHSEHFEWGVWASLSEDNFWQTMDAWDMPGRESTAPMFGWLSTELPGYSESTLNLRTLIHTQPVGERPHIELEPTEHPLAVEQREGVTWHVIAKRAEGLLPEG